MFIVRTLIGLALALLAMAIFNTMIGANLGQGGAVVFMLFSTMLITLTLRMPLPSFSEASETQTRAPKSRQ